MVAQHYRWDFYGLSTDSKPDATNPKVANGSTYYEADTSKLYVWYNDQWYEKEAGGGELPIASADTLGGIKVGDGLSITEAGVLSASGGGESGEMKKISSADYNYPENNPDGIASWLLPAGFVYYTEYGTKVYYTTSTSYAYNYPMIIIPVAVKGSEPSIETRTLFFSWDANHIGFQDTVAGADAGFTKF